MSRGRDIFSRLKPVLVILIKLLKLLPLKRRYGVLALFRNTPGLIGIGVRYVTVCSIAKSCGDNVKIAPYTLFSYFENCELGSNISINEFCSVGCLGGLKIGNDVSIAHGTTILTTEHDYQQTQVPMREAPTICKATVIEDEAWIGTKVVITAGVTIGQGTVVGAASVVTKDIPPHAIAVGVPARIIKYRNQTPQTKELVEVVEDSASFSETRRGMD